MCSIQPRPDTQTLFKLRDFGVIHHSYWLGDRSVCDLKARLNCWVLSNRGRMRW